MGVASSTLDRWFPVPKILVPPSAGVDISDASIKWLAFENAGAKGAQRISSWGELPLREGVVQGGLVQNVAELAASLREVKKHLGGIEHAHAALPEEAAYVFNMYVPQNSSREQTLHLIEFEFEARVPIAPAAAVYDFDVIARGENGTEEIAVVVFPREISDAYDAAFAEAGIELVSLELEARSIARAVSDPISEPITLLVDFGRARTGFAVLKHGIPIFTSTVGVGGDTMTHAVMDKLSLSEEEARRFNNDQGLLPDEGTKSAGLDALMGVTSALTDEIARHFHYWDTRRDEHGARMTPVEQVYLVGGSSNLRGLCDYIASRVQAPAVRPNVWRNVCDFDEYIPEIDRRASLQFATAIGLALRGV